MKIYNSISELVGHTPLVRLKNIDKDYSLSAKLLAKVEYLTSSAKLLTHRLDDKHIVILGNIGLHRESVARCFVEHRDIPYTAHRHIERTRNRRSSEREHINV